MILKFLSNHGLSEFKISSLSISKISANIIYENLHEKYSVYIDFVNSKIAVVDINLQPYILNWEEIDIDEAKRYIRSIDIISLERQI